MLDENIANLKNLEKEARAIQSSNQKHESIIHIAENDHSEVSWSLTQLVDDLRSREEQVSLTNQKLGHLKQ